MEQNFDDIILSSLKEIDPFKVILFGSRTTSSASTDGDLDLVVVTKSQDFPQSFSENKKHYIPVAKSLAKVNELVPIDLIVYTRPMFKKMMEQQSTFAKELTQNGHVIYEAAE